MEHSVPELRWKYELRVRIGQDVYKLFRTGFTVNYCEIRVQGTFYYNVF